MGNSVCKVADPPQVLQKLKDDALKSKQAEAVHYITEDAPLPMWQIEVDRINRAKSVPLWKFEVLEKQAAEIAEEEARMKAEEAARVKAEEEAAAKKAEEEAAAKNKAALDEEAKKKRLAVAKAKKAKEAADKAKADAAKETIVQEPRSVVLWKQIEQAVAKKGAVMVKLGGAIFQFIISDAGEKGKFVLNLKDGKGSCKQGEVPAPDITITMTDQDVMDLYEGKLDGMEAMASGKLKLKGNVAFAMKIPAIMEACK